MQGTHVLLEAARERGLRYLQVSTDEVYGSIEEGSFTEESPLAPSSPYSATKTGADLLVASYFHTYGLETVICRGSNNYGPYQYPEKLIPLMILNALSGDHLPVYGDGRQVRNWLFVEDFGARDRPRAGARRAGRGLQLRRPGRVREPRGRPADHRAHGCLAGADRVRHRPPRPRPPLLAGLREAPRARLERAGPLRRGTRAHGRTGIATTPGGGSRSAPASTCAYYERHYGRALECLTLASLEALEAEIVECRRCPRLVAWREEVARVKRAAFADQEYWGRPIPGFGDPAARIVVLGLAPAAHGGNRTGRIFTGDRSGDWLFAAMWRAGLANQAESVARDDGLRADATRGCAPRSAARRRSTGRPPPSATTACRGWSPSWRCSPRARVIVCLGGFAWDAALRVLGDAVPRPRPKFGHGAEATIGGVHPARQLPRLPAEHVHRPADRADARRGVRPREGAGGAMR